MPTIRHHALATVLGAIVLAAATIAVCVNAGTMLVELGRENSAASIVHPIKDPSRGDRLPFLVNRS